MFWSLQCHYYGTESWQNTYNIVSTTITFGFGPTTLKSLPDPNARSPTMLQSPYNELAESATTSPYNVPQSTTICAVA
jgi:hypothetical protein